MSWLLIIVVLMVVGVFKLAEATEIGDGVVEILISVVTAKFVV